MVRSNVAGWSVEAYKDPFALVNTNGGTFVIGFQDGTGRPDLKNAPTDIREVWTQDGVQALVSRFASETFEIELKFGNFDGTEYPVVFVHYSIRTPVCAKSDLIVDGRKKLISEGDVYFRTLSTGGVISSAKARARDWPDIMQICMDNREADIGRFIRRHLAHCMMGSLIKVSVR